MKRIIKPTRKDVLEASDSTIENTGLVDASGNQILRQFLGQDEIGLQEPHYVVIGEGTAPVETLDDIGLVTTGGVLTPMEAVVLGFVGEVNEAIDDATTRSEEFRLQHPTLTKVGKYALIVGAGALLASFFATVAKADSIEGVVFPTTFQLDTRLGFSNAGMSLLYGHNGKQLTKPADFDITTFNLFPKFKVNNVLGGSILYGANIPLIEKRNGITGVRVSGVGDIEMNLAYHFERDGHYLTVPLIGVLPTGTFDASAPLNVGSGLYQIGIFPQYTFNFSKLANWNLAVKYMVSEENRTTHVKPGNSMLARTGFDFHIGKFLDDPMIGPEVGILYTDDNTKEKHVVPHTSISRPYVGFNAYYFTKPGLQFRLNMQSERAAYEFLKALGAADETTRNTMINSIAITLQARVHF